MSVFPRIAALAFAAGLFASPAAAIDPFFPTFGNNGINVVHYGLDLNVTPASGRLDAHAGLLVFAEKRLTSFTLDLHALTVSRVWVRGVRAGFSQANDKLTITPHRPIPRGAAFSVVIAYSGVPDPIEDPTAPGFGIDLGWFRFGDASYVVSEPVGASTFYPANDEPTDKARFTFVVTVPAAYTGVANGALRHVWSHGGKKRFLWDMRQPMTTWLATVHVNKFDKHVSRAPDGTPIYVFASPGTPDEDVPKYALAGPMLTHFERLIGSYPFDSYGSVIVDDVPKLYYALETQAMSTFPVNVDGDEDFVSHELAHQWFGNSVSVKKWEDLWLAEGPATLFEFVWEHRGDRAAFRAAMEDNYRFVAALPPYEDEDPLPAPVVSSPTDLFANTVYYRGAATLYALQVKVGDRTFFRILRTFLAAYRGRNASTDDFIRTAVFVSRDPSVRPFLRAWLYEDAVPAMPGINAAAPSGPARHHAVVAHCGHRGAHVAACR